MKQLLPHDFHEVIDSCAARVQIADLIDNFGLTADLIEKIKKVAQLISGHQERLIETWKNFQHSKEEHLGLFESEEHADKVAEKVISYVIKCMENPIRPSVIRQSVTAGIIHCKIGLSISSYEGACFRIEEMISLIIQENYQPKEEVVDVRCYTNRYLAFLRYLAVEAYHEASKYQILKLSTIQERIFRTLVHDIRTPLTILLNSSQYVESASDDIPRQLKSIPKNTSRLQSSLSEAQALLSLASGQESEPALVFSVKSAFERTYDLYQEELGDHQIKLEIDPGPENLKIKCSLDGLVRHVLLNLLGNAARFSEAGKSVQLSAEENGNFVVIKCIDRGIGIPNSIMDSIFQFGRTNSRTGIRGDKGTGFGLPIAKAFLNQYSATITVSSISIRDDEINHGTTAIITFPKAH